MLHKLAEVLQIIDCLSLEKLGAGLDLLFKFNQLRLDRLCLGSNDSPGTKLYRPIEFVAAQVLTGCHLADCLQQLQGIKVEDAFSLLMVADRYGIAGKAEDVLYAPGVGQQKLGLQVPGGCGHGRSSAESAHHPAL